MKQTRQAVRAIKQSIFLDVYANNSTTTKAREKNVYRFGTAQYLTTNYSTKQFYSAGFNKINF
jgi:hypothetical protein